MVWKPGQSGNIHGRPRKYPEPPPGTDPRYFYKQAALRDEYRYSAEELRLEDPVLFQHKLLENENLPLALRATIAANIAPYCHPKLGITQPPRFIETEVEVPDFKTIEEAETFLATLAQRFASSELGAQSALDLSTLVRNWISAKHADAEFELKQLAASADPNPTIRIEGGLPDLPGTSIIMPSPEGPAIEGEVAEADGEPRSPLGLDPALSKPEPTDAA
jgi:hypothetical protein